VLYRGTAAFRRNDNNFTPTGTEGGRANSFGWTSQGVLEEVATGSQVNCRGNRQYRSVDAGAALRPR